MPKSNVETNDNKMRLGKKFTSADSGSILLHLTLKTSEFRTIWQGSEEFGGRKKNKMPWARFEPVIS